MAAVPNPAVALAPAKLATVPLNPTRGWAPDGIDTRVALRNAGSAIASALGSR